jgi:hypothetical protein
MMIRVAGHARDGRCGGRLGRVAAAEQHVRRLCEPIRRVRIVTALAADVLDAAADGVALRAPELDCCMARRDWTWRREPSQA